MRQQAAADILASLASPIRLDVYRRLIRAGRDGLVAGEIAAALDLPPSNLSFHLKELARAGLVRAEQEGRFQRYRANLELMRELVAYLTEECCAGNPGECAL